MRRILLILGMILVVLALPAQAQEATETAEAVPAAYTLESVYVPMADGVRIAVDVWLPSDTSAPVPALLNATRYWRGIENVTDPTPEVGYFLASGYAVVIADVRGTGASEGVQTLPWSHEEMSDLGEIVGWIAEQEWSNGHVGAYGVSYAGNTAELATLTVSPALDAFALRFSTFDVLSNLALPGGVYNRHVEAWQAFNEGLDQSDPCVLSAALQMDCATLESFTPGVRSVDEDTDRSILNGIIEARTENVDMAALITEYDQNGVSVEGESILTVSPYSNRETTAESGVPIFVQVGWLDAATVDGALSRYLTLSNPQHVWIGPWSHAGNFETDPFSAVDAPVAPTQAEQLGELVAFFDSTLKDEPAAIDSEIRYYTMNAGTWSTAETWPPEGVEMARWYMSDEASLTQDVPTAEEGADSKAVDYSATSGETTRWHTEVTNGDVIYPDRAAEDEKLITYTSAPLESDTVITGNPEVTLYVTSTEPDAAFHVYLEDVAPDGTVTYITEGVLRGQYRNPADSAYEAAGIYHSLLADNAEPLEANEVSEIRLSLYATSVLIEAGHQIRVAVAGADAGTFGRYPAEGDASISIERNATNASFIDLPIQTQ